MKRTLKMLLLSAMLTFSMIGSAVSVSADTAEASQNEVRPDSEAVQEFLATANSELDKMIPASAEVIAETTYIVNAAGTLYTTAATDIESGVLGQVYRNCTLIAYFGYLDGYTSTSKVTLSVGSYSNSVAADKVSRVLSQSVNFQDGMYTCVVSGQNPGLIYVVKCYKD